MSNLGLVGRRARSRRGRRAGHDDGEAVGRKSTPTAGRSRHFGFRGKATILYLSERHDDDDIRLCSLLVTRVYFDRRTFTDLCIVDFDFDVFMYSTQCHSALKQKQRSSCPRLCVYRSSRAFIFSSLHILYFVPSWHNYINNPANKSI